MHAFLESIDRFMPSCTFCFTQDVISLLNQEFIFDAQFKCPEKHIYLPRHYCILPLFENVKIDFWEFLDKKYDYLLVDLLNKNVFCIDKTLRQYLQLFSKAQSYKDVAEINIKGGYGDYFINLVEEGFLSASDQDSNKTTHSNASSLEYKQLGYKIIKSLNKSEYKHTYLVQKKANKSIFILKQFIERSDISHFKLMQNEILIRKKMKHSGFFPKLVFHDMELLFSINEYLKGQDLVFYLKNVSGLNEKIHIMKSIVYIISDLHANNIIHGDIHLGQFRVTKENTIKLLDLDLAIDFDSTIDFDLDFAGGSYEYLEPEAIIINPFKLLKLNNKNKRAEVYRLGILLYTILYDEYPYMELTWKQLFESKIKNDPIFYRRTKKKEVIPTYLITALKQCLMRDTKKRFSSAQELYDKINLTTQTQ